MANSNSRPSTPNLKFAGGAGGGRGGGGGGTDPASPPQTPTSISPLLNGNRYNTKQPRIKGRMRHQAPYQNLSLSATGPPDDEIQPTGNGHEFSFSRPPNTNRFAQLSPQSSSEDDEDEEDEDVDSSDAESSVSDEPRSLSDGEGRNMGPILVEDDSNDDDDDDDSSESSDSDSDEEATDEEDDEDVMISAPQVPECPSPPAASHTKAHGISVTASVSTIVVEELSDFDSGDDDREHLLQPTGFESPKSARSRSRYRDALAKDGDAVPLATAIPLRPRPRQRARPKPVHPDLDGGMMQFFQNLNCSGDNDTSPDPDERLVVPALPKDFGVESDSDEFDPNDPEYNEFLRRQREIRMRKRRSHGTSTGKRTHSELSDSDKEDLGDEVNGSFDAAGASARRMRRKIGDRRSLQFQDPPPERIEELEEPSSCEDEAAGGAAERAAFAYRFGVTRDFGGMLFDGASLARELPYYDLEIMEVDEE